MGRRAATKKLTYDAGVVAFQIIRQDACAQLQLLATAYGIAGVSATVIAACEQAIFKFASHRLADKHIYTSLYCRRYYKLLMYDLLGLPPPDYLNFIISVDPQVKLHALANAKRRILFGPDKLPSKDQDPAITKPQTHFDRVCAELEAHCTDGGADEFTPECRKCRSNKDVEFEAKQTRSADEGMTIEYECKKCKVKWRES